MLVCRERLLAELLSSEFDGGLKYKNTCILYSEYV